MSPLSLIPKRCLIQRFNICLEPPSSLPWLAPSCLLSRWPRLVVAPTMLPLDPALALSSFQAAKQIHVFFNLKVWTVHRAAALTIRAVQLSLGRSQEMLTGDVVGRCSPESSCI